MPDDARVIGLDHHRSPIELRERMAVGVADLGPMLEDLTAIDGIDEAVVLSTCNRSELYCAGELPDADVMALLAERQGVDLPSLSRHCYTRHDRSAIHHLFRVAASLESMVVGEYQILHQVRFAYEQARLHRCTGPVLNPCFQRALAVGKEVRTETAIGEHKLSMASIAVDLARQIHGDLARTRLLVVGAGEMAELAVTHFIDQGVREIAIINRTRERALAIDPGRTREAEVHVHHWSELHEAIAESDVVVASTASAHPVISLELVRRALQRRRRPLMFIDLAVPRDVDATVAELEEAYLYNVDHLEQVVMGNRRLREEEVEGAARLVDRRVDEALAAVDRDLGALRGAVAAWFEALVEEEARRLVNKSSLAGDEAEAARYALKRLGGKLQHRLQVYLSERGQDPQATEIVRQILGL